MGYNYLFDYLRMLLDFKLVVYLFFLWFRMNLNVGGPIIIKILKGKKTIAINIIFLLLVCMTMNTKYHHNFNHTVAKSVVRLDTEVSH